MYFLIERNNGIAWIVAHGCKRNDLDSSFMEEAYRLLSGTCTKVEIDNEPLEFNAGLIHEKVNTLNSLMLNGNNCFQFKSTTGYDPSLYIQEYHM